MCLVAVGASFVFAVVSGDKVYSVFVSKRIYSFVNKSIYI